MAIGTGHGATLAFGTQSFTAAYREIGGTSKEREAINTSHLGTTDYHTKIPGDLVDAGGFDATALYDPAVGGPSIAADPETVTVTFPLTGGSTPATLAGSAFVTSASEPSLATDQLMEQALTITWADGPTFTAET